MYLALLTAAIAVFFTARFVASRYTNRQTIANASGAVAVLVVLQVGIWVRAAFFAVLVSAPVADPMPPVSVAAAPPSKPTPPSNYVARPIKAIAIAGAPILASIDSVDTDQPVPQASTPYAFLRGSTIVLGGWAASSRKTQLRRLIVVVDHRRDYDATARYGLERPDVAKAYNTQAILRSGFNSVWLHAADFTPGKHVLQVGGVSAESGAFQMAPQEIAFTIE